MAVVGDRHPGGKDAMSDPSSQQDEPLCLCGHTAHWHGVADGVQGAGECEHDGDCECSLFVARLAGTPRAWRPIRLGEPGRYDYMCLNGHPFAAPAAEHGGPWSTLVCSMCGATARLELCWECASPLGQPHTAGCPFGEEAA